jgi:hypothetical protein
MVAEVLRVLAGDHPRHLLIPREPPLAAKPEPALDAKPETAR